MMPSVRIARLIRSAARTTPPGWCNCANSTALLLVLVISVAGCEENLPDRDDIPMPYSLYGVLSPSFDTQSIRVYPLENKPTLGDPASLGVDVTTTDLTTGSRHVWRDTVLVDPNGQHEHVYWAPFRAEFGHVYRLEAVRRSDGATSWAEVRIPTMPAVRMDVFEVPVVQLFVEGEDIRVLKPEARYTVSIPGGEFPFRTISVSHEAEERRVENGWRVSIRMAEDTDEVVSKYFQSVDLPLNPVLKILKCAGLVLYRLELSVIIGDVPWEPPGGFLDPLILSQPKAMSNVENGFGFIGGGFRISEAAFPSREAVGGTCLGYGL